MAFNGGSKYSPTISAALLAKFLKVNIIIQIPIISSLIHYFKVVYSYAGKKLYILILLIFLGAISESIGIAMLLPLLNIDNVVSDQGQYTRAIHAFSELVGMNITLSLLLMLLLIAFLFKGAFVLLQKTLASYIKFSLTKDIRIDFCNKYKGMKYSYYTNTSIGYLNNIITTEINLGVGALNRYTIVIGSLIFILIYISFAIIINCKMTIVVLFLSLLLFALMRSLSRLSRKLSLLVSETNAQVQSLLIQTIYSFKYLKATDGFTHIFKRLFGVINKNYIYYFKNSVLTSIPSSIIEPISILFISGLVLYYVGFQGESIAEIFVLVIFFYKAFSYVFQFQSDWQKFNASLGGLEVISKANRILNNNVEKVGNHQVNTFNKAIELRNVNFSYGLKQVFSDVSLTIQKNKSIGIVGESGAGKTTLFDIVTGLLTPQSGKISIDGIGYSELEFSSLRNIIGYVTQEPVIFNDTVANNISFWECDSQEDICRKRIKDAAVLANCDRFINETEMGYLTIIGDKGVKLSGGQRQRIAIARELFKEPEIMIFDEATSALDTESEQLIQQSINSLKGERTLVIIAHRLSTVKNCDYIYVFKEGRIVEEGSFDKLYNDKDSVFSRMCQAQNL
jgi:subfamily B ATP-binding cassette protein MsbA